MISLKKKLEQSLWYFFFKTDHLWSIQHSNLEAKTESVEVLSCRSWKASRYSFHWPCFWSFNTWRSRQTKHQNVSWHAFILFGCFMIMWCLSVSFNDQLWFYHCSYKLNMLQATHQPLCQFFLNFLFKKNLQKYFGLVVIF